MNTIKAFSLKLDVHFLKEILVIARQKVKLQNRTRERGRENVREKERGRESEKEQ